MLLLLLVMGAVITIVTTILIIQHSKGNTNTNVNQLQHNQLYQQQMQQNHIYQQQIQQQQLRQKQLIKQQAEDQNALALAHEEIQGAKEVAAEWEHRSKSVRKIPFLGTDTLSYQSDFILRFKDHTKEWNDLVSDFQNKYLPTLKEGIDSFILRVKNVEL